MRIAFDATGILGPGSKNRGIGNYSTGQFASMVDQDTENEYFFFNLFEEDFSFKKNIAEGNNLKEFSFYAGRNNFLLTDPELDIVKKVVQKFLLENHIDVFYFTSPFDGNIKYQVEWFRNVKTVVLVYDIIPYIFKERYFPDKNSFDWYMERIEFIRCANRIQVISQSVKDDLVQYLQFPADKIDVIWGAVDKRYREMQVPEEEKQKLFQRFGIRDRFVMCTGGDDWRKNIAGLIEAYSKLKPEIREEYQLVIVCKLSTEAVEKYEKQCKDLGCGKQVVLTNFVTNEELLEFYNLASLMAFPSTYEGFGLPVVEAWTCGTPVLTSNNSSLVQIAGEGAVLVDPYDIDDIARGLEFALTECDLEELLKKGRQQLKQFQWERVAELSIASINTLKQTEPFEGKERRNLALFLPLQLFEKEYSNSNIKIISELSEKYNLDIFIDDDCECSIDLGKFVHILNHKEYKNRAEKYFDTIYCVGNSAFYLYMLPYIWDYAGTVVLEQYNLYELAAGFCFTKNKQNYDKFEEMLMSDYPAKEVHEYIFDLKNERCTYQNSYFQINSFVVDYAKKVIVPERNMRRRLLERNVGRSVCQISYNEIPATVQKMIEFIECEPFAHVDESDIQYMAERLVMFGADKEEMYKMADTLTYLM